MVRICFAHAVRTTASLNSVHRGRQWLEDDSEYAAKNMGENMEALPSGPARVGAVREKR